MTPDPTPPVGAPRPTPTAVELLEPARAPEPGPYRFSPLISWLLATTDPEVLVELGSGDEASLRATCGRARRSGRARLCAAVLLDDGSAAAVSDFARVTGALSDEFGDFFTSYDGEGRALAALPEAGVGFLHVALFDAADDTAPDLQRWLPTLAPGAVVTVTTTAAGGTGTFTALQREIAAAYPTVSVSLGLSAEALVAQRPDRDATTPVVDALERAPFAVGAFLAVLGEQMELEHLRADGPESSEAVRTLIGRVIDQQQAERGAFLAALTAYRDETARLSEELVAARGELRHELEAARHEREQLVAQFLDRVDELSAKVSTTASRARAEKEDAEALLKAETRKAETYAGQAAVAQSVLDDMRHSTSWRITAPVRVLSRLLARKAQPAAPEH